MQLDEAPNFHSKGKAVPLQSWCGPEGSRSFRLPDFHDIWYIKVTRLSASRNGRLYPQEIFLVHIFTRARGGVVVKALRYKPAGRGFDSRWCHWNFSVT